MSFLVVKPLYTPGGATRHPAQDHILKKGWLRAALRGSLLLRTEFDEKLVAEDDLVLGFI